MCIFCASIPAVLAVGVDVNARQKRDKKALAKQDKTQTAQQIPAIKMSLGIAAAMLVCSVVYHTIQ